MENFIARPATAAEIQRWDQLVTANPNGGDMLQSAAFAAVKRNHGWETRFVAFQGQNYTSYNLILEKSFPVLGKLWYLIKGPDVAAVEDIPAMLQALKSFARSARLRVFAVKVEPAVVASEEARQVLADAGLLKVPNLQPNDSTALLDISPDSDDVLASLASRGRNAVRRAIREGVEVVRMPPEESTMETMYSLMVGTITAKSTNKARDYEYYRQFWTEFCNRGQGQFYFVFENGVAAVGAFVVHYGAKATYKDGGSLQKRSQYGDSHLVQWTAINDMKELGATQYDLCGTPPSDQAKDTSHPHYGLGLFKTSFSRTITDFVGCYDAVLRPVRYQIWSRFGERVARQLYVRFTGRVFY